MSDEPEADGKPGERAEPDFMVVGIGSSAGGVTALKQVFSRVEPASGIAYVVIMHLSPLHEINLAQLLQMQTPIPVTQVTETVRVEPDHVYVIPPSKYLMIEDGNIKLTEPERMRGAGHSSIDLFFRTLADAYGKSAVSVLLSGTGSDGILGLRRIKEEGGFALAQDPEEAEYGAMPRNARQRPDRYGPAGGRNCHTAEIPAGRPAADANARRARGSRVSGGVRGRRARSAQTSAPAHRQRLHPVQASHHHAPDRAPPAGARIARR
jgi:CheB methylesterase